MDEFWQKALHRQWTQTPGSLGNEKVLHKSEIFALFALHIIIGSGEKQCIASPEPASRFPSRRVRCYL
ncbi:Hypothetical predicted protein [Podarcis lilfordi]|uniref:Uncharacterized protein n=1 Tax=Podarcis lilfordi TaxID=74358 RepID=A0AA35KJU6_9SAUR|nr:Hypothetical predicted protein [Podarcis lilfordi]